MLDDRKLQSSVSKIIQRSERQIDPEKLVHTYVDIGPLPQLINYNNQIFYGRRGTGKTHVMKVLESQFVDDSSIAAVYIDCRTLGSTSQFSDRDLPIQRRCLSLFRDFLLEIHRCLLEKVIENPNDQANQALDQADHLLAVITEPVASSVSGVVASESTEAKSTNYGLAAGALVGGGVPSGSVNASARRDQGRREFKEESVQWEEKIIFPELHSN